MKAEIYFFMTAPDAEAFIKHVEELVDSIEEHSESSIFIIGDCQIEYLPSIMIESSLLTGSIAIDSGGIDNGCTQYLRANKTYKALRNWIKKGYYSRLCTWTEGEDMQATSSRTRDLWLGPDAKKNKESNNDMQLRLSLTSDVLFDLAPETSTMGGIKPKAGKKKK
ncbi:MAG: hypothetical protein V3W04_15300 [Gammaproteobacteria bacterium]